jgi:hypothetical protein
MLMLYDLSRSDDCSVDRYSERFCGNVVEEPAGKTGRFKSRDVWYERRCWALVADFSYVLSVATNTNGLRYLQSS